MTSWESEEDMIVGRSTHVFRAFLNLWRSSFVQYRLSETYRRSSNRNICFWHMIRDALRIYVDMLRIQTLLHTLEHLLSTPLQRTPRAEMNETLPVKFRNCGTDIFHDWRKWQDVAAVSTSIHEEFLLYFPWTEGNLLCYQERRSHDVPALSTPKSATITQIFISLKVYLFNTRCRCPSLMTHRH